MPGVPTDDYGAASGQAGRWNGVPFTVPNMGLRGLEGGLTTVVFTNDTSFGVSWDHPGTIDGDEALLDDLGDPGLFNGSYRFDGPASRCVPGLDLRLGAGLGDGALRRHRDRRGRGTQVVGGTWSGALEEGITHAVHTQLYSPRVPFGSTSRATSTRASPR